MNAADPIHLHTPLSNDDVEKLRIGDLVNISGSIFTARDAAHQRMKEAILKGERLPFDVSGQVIYYVGPTPARPGRIIGSAGPTTASRMDSYTPILIERGLKGTIGKGRRSQAVRDAMKKHGCAYFGALEGAAALIAECVKSVTVIAYEDLGTEALRLLTVERFPVTLVNDAHGGDLYWEGQRQYRTLNTFGKDS